jgi:succinate dehydrogenase / fumarate reductase cytochrome b subunit
MGLWLVLFLMEHLLVNSQAALLLGENGKGFVDMVNSIHNFPYLQVIEVTLLGVPILIHMIWGVKYLLTAKSNASKSDGSKPALPQYGRNRAYSWQRITSWILLIGLTAHVVKFRFLDYPDSVQESGKTSYLVKISTDNGLYTVADRLGVTLYDGAAIDQEQRALQERGSEKSLVEAADAIRQNKEATTYDAQKAIILNSAQKYEGKVDFVSALSSKVLQPNQVIAVAPDFGTASLLLVRDTFKSPIYVGLYTVFVLAACFHAFNGLWTFLITWGVILKMTAQKMMVNVAVTLMIIVTFLGLAAIWGTYFLNLKY